MSPLSPLFCRRDSGFVNRSIGVGIYLARRVSVLFSFCLRRGTFFSWRKKVTKERHSRGKGFRFPFPLENPPSLNDQRGRAVALPLWKHPPWRGDCQIAPLPQSGKGRWRPRAAICKAFLPWLHSPAFQSKSGSEERSRDSATFRRSLCGTTFAWQKQAG